MSRSTQEPTAPGGDVHHTQTLPQPWIIPLVGVGPRLVYSTGPEIRFSHTATIEPNQRTVRTDEAPTIDITWDLRGLYCFWCLFVLFLIGIVIVVATQVAEFNALL